MTLPLPQFSTDLKKEILERISNIGTSIKLTPEVHHSSDDLLVISVLQEWDTEKGIVIWFVKFKDGKAIQLKLLLKVIQLKRFFIL